MTTPDVKAAGSSGPIDRDTVDDCADDGAGEARFPGLRVETQLGVGGSGVVYRAWDAANGRHVALKVLRADRWGSETQRSRFRREVEIHRRIADPGVVGIFADGTTLDGAPWFTMELIAGASLQDRIDRAALPPLATCVGWIRDVARTLARLHAQGVVHRDVKPSNILLQDGSRALLADFGVVLLSDEERLTVGPRAVGTPRFMAPEQQSGSVDDWRLVDVYALGLVLAGLLGPGRSSLDLAYVVRRATAADPGDRYPGAAALADELDRWLSGHAVRLRASALLWRARRSPWTTGLPHVAAASAALVLVVLAVVSMQAAQRDAQAAADWEVARTGLADVWATGDVQAADDWVTRFASDPARLRTPAAGRAWLELAALHRDAARDEDELDALGGALAATEDPEVQAAAIAEVVAVYRRLRRWPALGHLLAALPAEGIALDAALHGAARADLALAEGDVAAAIAATPAEAPLLAPFQALRAAPLAAIGALDGDGGLEWVVGEAAARDPVRERDEHGALVWRFGPLTFAKKLRDEGGRGLLHTRTGLWALDPGGATRIGPDMKDAVRVGPRVFGVREDAPLGLVELVAGVTSPAHPATDALGAYVQGVTTGDVDGDGAPELVVSFGPAFGFLVRVYRVDPHGGPITLLAGTRPGDVGSVAVVATPGGPRIVGLMIRVNPNATIFGAEDPWGAPCGIQTWRYDQTASPPQLRAVAQYELPAGYCEASTMQWADLDGDGETELLVNQWSRQNGALLVLRHRNDEISRAFSLPDHEATAVTQVRGRDIVLLSHVLPGGRVLGRWLVGVGDQQLPRRAWDTAPIDPGADPTVRLFAACSLDRSAADSCLQRGDSARAARFLERAGQPAKAARALGDAAHAAGDAAALAHAVDLAIAGADAPLARGLLDQLVALSPERGAAKTAEHADRLTPGWTLDPTRPLPADLQVVVPAALRHDLVNHELRVRVPAGIDAVLRLPLRATGGPVWLHAAGELTRTEWGCVADIRLRRPGAPYTPYTPYPYALSMQGTGSGRSLFRGFDNLTRDRITRPGVVTPIDLRLDTAANGVQIRGAWNHQDFSRYTAAERPQAGEAWELVVLGGRGWGGPPGPVCELVLRQLDLGGFAVARTPPPPPPPAIAWILGDADPPPGEPADDPVFVALLRLDASLRDRVRVQYGAEAANRLFFAAASVMDRDDDLTVDVMLGMGDLTGVPPNDRLKLQLGHGDALIRVGRPSDARAGLTAVWQAATAFGQASWRSAYYAAALLAELDVAAGDDAGAMMWLRRAAGVVPDVELGERMLRHRPRLRDHWPRLTGPLFAADRSSP